VEREDGEEAPAEQEVSDNGAGDGDAPEDGAAPKKRTRRGSRGGRNRRKRPASTPAGEETPEAPEADVQASPDEGDTAYVPMSEWLDDFGRES
jgi:hypothetical protein